MEMENVLARVRCYGTSMLMPVHFSTYIFFLQLCRSDNRVRFLRRKNIFVLRGVGLEVVSLAALKQFHFFEYLSAGLHIFVSAFVHEILSCLHWIC